MLRAVLIDDERPALDELSYLLKKNSVEVIGSFQNTEGALDFIAREKPDIIFLDIEMRGVNGIDFGVHLQNSTENAAIIFVTAYPEYALEAFQAYPLDYIVKPVDEEHLARTLKHVRETSVNHHNSQDRNLYIRCFGNFEIIHGSDKVKLPTKKTRELLAYLLCNEGSTIYRDDLMRLIFNSGDSEKDGNNLRVTMYRIRNAFREAGIGKNQFLIHDNLTVSIADGICDLVDFQRFIRNNQIETSENIEKAEKVVGIVNGDLFVDIDTLWITEKREWLIAQAEELLINMSIYYQSVGLTEQAEAMLLRQLSLNPVSEMGYRRLLDLYIQIKNTLKYRFCYERFLKMMEKEFGERTPKIYADYYEKLK